ncbi:hypothetical protein L916_00790, partial [Phytophthora nicotianae]
MNKEAGDEGLPVETQALQTRSETGGAEELQTGNVIELQTNGMQEFLEKLQIDEKLQTDSVGMQTKNVEFEADE